MSLSVTSVFERILMGIMSPLRVSGFAGYRNTRAKGQLGYIALPTVAPQSSSTRATGNFNPSTLTRRSRIKPPSVHRRMLKNLAQFSHNQKYRLGTQQTGNPPSLRRTRRSGDTCSSNKRRKPLVRSLASRPQSGFAHRIGIPFLDHGRRAAPRPALLARNWKRSPFLVNAIQTPFMRAVWHRQLGNPTVSSSFSTLRVKEL